MNHSGLEPPGSRETQRLLNPLLYALFEHPTPSNRLKEIRAALAKSNGYTILVPSTAVLEWSIDRDTALPFRDLCLQDEFLLSHVINTPTTFRNHQRPRYFGTLNGRTVIVKDRTVFTLKGFKAFGRARITLEYVYNPGTDYLPLDSQFIVYEIDAPLIGAPVPSKEVSPTLSKFDLAVSPREQKSKESLKKAAATTSSCPSPPQLNGGTNVHNSSPSTTTYDLEKLLSKYPLLHRHVFSALLVLIENFDCSQAQTEEDVYNALGRTVESAFEIFQSGEPTSVAALAADFDLSGQDIADLIHRFIETNLNEQLFHTLADIRQDFDASLYDELERLKNIDIGQIGLPITSYQELFQMEKSVWAAIKELKLLPKARGADAKAQILLNVVRLLGASGGQSTTTSAAALSGTLKTDVGETFGTQPLETKTVENGNIVNADFLVSLLILVVVRSGLEKLDTELHYIRNFTSLDVESGHLGYALLSFEGVVYHIRNESSKLAELSSLNSELWSKVTAKDDSAFNSYLHILMSSCPDWKTIAASRNNAGESVLAMAIQARKPTIVRAALTCEAIFDFRFILYDISEAGKSLLVSAVETERQDLIEEILSKVLAMPEDLQKQYFAISDSWGRTVAHYFFHSSWLMHKIGRSINWNTKDKNGQTPLFALCRCYDHPEYSKLVRDGFRIWTEAAESSVEKIHLADVMDHVDTKGNSLMHIVKDRDSVEMILNYDADVNWPNEKGLTPLMLFSKFSRLEAVSLLVEDDRVDLNRRELRGLTALELAKDPATITYLEELYLFQNAKHGERVTKISRTVYSENELYFIISSGIMPDKSSITSVRRSFSDFLFLQKWLAYENPYSWVPVLKSPRNPLSAPLRPSRQVIQETCLRLNAFIRILTMHPTFAEHELLWEFLLVQDLSQQQSIERCRRKLESKRELQFEDLTVYTVGDLELIEVFFNHARAETRLLQSQLTKLVRHLIKLKNKSFDCSSAYKILDAKLGQVEFLKLFGSVMKPHFELTYTTYDNAMENLVIDMTSTVSTSDVMLFSLTQPLSLIQQLKAQELSLIRGRATLSKLSNKNSWPLGMFEDKRHRDIKQTEDSIYITQNEIQRLSNDIKYSHVTLAMELGGFHQSQEREVYRAIEEFTMTKIRAEKERLQRLLRLQRNIQRI